MSTEKDWRTFAAEASELAQQGQALLYQQGDVASAFLATVAADGGPRVHPVFPVLADSELWVFIVQMSPKYQDLTTNGWYALHSMPTPAGGEEFYLRGHAQAVDDEQTRARVVAATQNRQGTQPFEALFQLRIQRALYTHWENWGTEQTWPTYRKWQA